MIINLELKNFRRHEALSLPFVEGLNVLRGANEAGKTTVIEAILYALYGAKALRNTLAETVTWGQPEKTLSVRLVIQIRGVMYVFDRSKNSAECNGDDGTQVTGQNEVTATAADLLGADARTASLLMLASQSGLRGALDDGPAAVSGLMAKLADFDVIDRILEAATQRLSLGSTAPIAEKITQAEQDLEDAKAAKPDPSNRLRLDEAIVGARASVERLTQLEAETLQPAVTATAAAVDEADEWNRLGDIYRTSAADLTRRIAAEDVKIAAALKEITSAPGAAVIAALREDAALEANHAKELALYRQFQKIQYPEDFWEGTVEAFDLDLMDHRNLLDAWRNGLASMEGQRNGLRSRRITNGKCPTCGHAARSDEHVKAHNDEIDAELAVLEGRISEASQAVSKGKVDVDTRTAIQKAHEAMQRALAPFGDRIKVDEGFVPHRATWAAPVPSDDQPMEAARKLQEAEQTQRLAEQASGRHEAAVAAVCALQHQFKEARELADGKPHRPVQPLKEAYDAAYAAYAANAVALREAKASLEGFERELVMHTTAELQSELRIKGLTERIAEYHTDIKRTEFNNTLVAKLKKVKPAITDHLWNSVLAAVGTFFSQMRGEPSVVSKDKDGFSVNGKSVDSLSGSTIDVLALAVRVALTKTFIPHASFVVLDEPAHGCDNDRTGNVLGFLAGAGFTQTILASHDELSEAVADSVLSLTT